MNILSLFDGMSCGRIALDRAEIKVDNYYASEIDKYAIAVSKKNYPDIIQLGDVVNVDISILPKIDLLIGSYPCQGFSFSDKQLNFNDPRSKLFFEFVRILNELRVINPNIKFLLENVRMKKEYQYVISGELGVEPIMINSSLLSAQNRNRLYWTNIEGITQPKDKGLLLKDVVEDTVDSKYYMNKEYITKLNKKVTCNKKAYALSATQSYSARNHNRAQCNLVGELDIKEIDQIKRVYGIDGKYPTLTTMTGGNRQPKIFTNSVRKVTPLECERLQTVPDNYTEGVSDSQRYKMLGNGWTVDVIAHIFRNINAAQNEGQR